MASGTWQLPYHTYVKVQSCVVRYDGSEGVRVDKFLKVLAGGPPNAFTGLSPASSLTGPASVSLCERLVERVLYTKVAYAMPF